MVVMTKLHAQMRTRINLTPTAELPSGVRLRLDSLPQLLRRFTVVQVAEKKRFRAQDEHVGEDGRRQRERALLARKQAGEHASGEDHQHNHRQATPKVV